MSNNITFNGSVYVIPDVGETDWGQNVTDFLVAIPNGALQPTAGLFSLSADVDFGSNFGLESIYYKSRTANIATVGIVRLARTDGVVWRNQANLADLILGVDSNDNLTFNGVILESDVLPSANIFVGNSSNESTARAMTGDIGIDNVGLTSIQSGVIVDADVHSSAAISLIKLAPTTSDRLLYSDVWGFIAPSSWVSISAGSHFRTSQNGQLQFNDSTSNQVVFAAPLTVTTYTVLWPTAQGAAGEIMINDGAGNLAWGVSTGMGTVNSGVSGRLAYYVATGTVVDDTTAITTDGSTWARVASGSAAVPGLGFNVAPGSGMAYNPAAGTSLIFSHIGVQRLSFDTTNGWTISNARGLAVPVGAIGAPSVNRVDNPDTGIHFPSTSQVAITIDGANAFIFDTATNTSLLNIAMGGTQKLTGLVAGSGAGDSVRYEQVLLLAGGTMSGAIAMGTNKITGLGAATTNGDALRYEQLIGVYLPLAGGTMGGALISSGGSVALPGLGIGGTTDGLYKIGTNNVGLTLNGSLVADFSVSGMLIKKVGGLCTAQDTVNAGVHMVGGTGTTAALANDETMTFEIGDNAGGTLFLIVNESQGRAGVFVADWAGTVTLIAGNATNYTATDTDNGTNLAVFKSASNNTVSIKNYSGLTRGTRVHILGFSPSATAPA